MNLNNDMECVESMQQDSKQAFEILFKKYYQPLVIFANHYISNKEASEDIVQTFFCEIWSQRTNLTINSSVKNYFFRSIKNRTLNWIQYNERFMRKDDMNRLLDDLHALDPIDIDELEIEVINALSKLTEKERQIFLMHYKEGYSYQEIADMCGISKNTVKTHLLRSRKMFTIIATSVLWIAIR